MQNLLKISLLVLLFALSLSAAPLHKAIIEGDKEKITEIDLVLDGQEPLLGKWLAPVLQDYLEQITGKRPEIVATPGTRFAIVLGDGPLAKANGLDLNTLPLEGYFIHRKGKLLFLCGKDDPVKIPQSNCWKMWFQHGSISAMYDFLERFADCIFACPAPDGMSLPRRGALFLPASIHIEEAPDFTLRSLGVYVTANLSPFNGENKDALGVAAKNRQMLTQRNSFQEIPFGHGLVYLQLIRRFAESHPEFFALMPDGRRYCTPDLVHPGHICFSNPQLRDSIYEDIKAFLTHQTPASRGFKHWDVNGFSRNYASVMPQDWLYFCCCPECAKIAPGARFYSDGKPEAERARAAEAINETLWKFSAEFANRLTKDGIDGIITQMAYSPMREPPRCEIPANMAVMVALPGQAHHQDWDNEIRLLKQWNEKLGRKVYIWTYPGKAMSKAAMVGVPAAMHRHNGKYFKLVKDYIHGAFLEEETDVYVYNHLNEYVFTHLAWDNSTDAEALLEKYYKGMYGAAAPVMQKYFDALEDLWCSRILVKVENGPLGPVAILPTVDELWNDIYSDARMQEFEALFQQAVRATAQDAPAQRRVCFMHREFHGPIVAAREAHLIKKQGFRHWQASLGESIVLRPCKGAKADVLTKATLTETDSELVLDIVCQEPSMDTMAAKTGPEIRDGNCWMDSDFEFFINPSGDRKTFFQFAFNSKGSLLDSKCYGRQGDTKWNSNAKVTTSLLKDAWTARLTIPKASLPPLDFSRPVPVNFCRHRVAANLTQDYQWTPSEEASFQAIEHWGTISSAKPSNLLKNGDFAENAPNGSLLAWSPWKSKTQNLKEDVCLDKQIFMTGGTSLRIRNEANVRVATAQKFHAKANAKYRLSYYVRIQDFSLDGVENPASAGVGAYIYAAGKEHRLPRPSLNANTEWSRQEFEFQTGDKNMAEDGTVECTIGLWNWLCHATVWFDKVTISEIE